MNQPASVKSGFQVRFVEDETPPVHDILFTDVSGVVRQSLDVYGDAEGAEIAIVELEASGKLPYGWDECPELFGGL